MKIINQDLTIIHLITGLGGGGAEQIVFELSKQANSENIKNIVVSVTSINDIEQKFIDNNIEYYFLDIDSLGKLQKGLFLLKNLIKKQAKPVLHCHMFHAFLVAFFIKIQFWKIPIVFTIHTNKVGQFYRKTFLYATKFLRKYDVIFSENSKRWYLKNNAIIQNGIDIAKFSNTNTRIPKENFIFLFLGRLNEPKNPLILPTLAKKLLDHKHLHFRIHIVGDGDLKESLLEKIKELNVTEYFKLLGFQNDVPKFLKESNCLIMPSLWEGMPVSLLEAGAANLPIIATPVGSVPDFLNQQSAYITEVSDFHDKMIDVMEDYTTALEKSKRFHEQVKSNFSIRSVFQKNIEIYNKCL